MNEKMPNILLLYDLQEKDLARNVKDFLAELNAFSITMIPCSPDQGKTLEDKEKDYFNSAQGAIFLLTPRSKEYSFPSPSVCEEIGRAKEKFNGQCVNYLLEEGCTPHATLQKAYIQFDRTQIRSVIQALTHLIKNLKEAGFYRAISLPHQSGMDKIDLEELSPLVKNIVCEMSSMRDGIIGGHDLDSLCLNKYKLSVQKINFLKKDLSKFRLTVNNQGYDSEFWQLTNLGLKIARIVTEEKEKGYDLAIALKKIVRNNVLEQKG